MHNREVRLRLIIGLLFLAPLAIPSTTPTLRNVSTVEHFKHSFNADDGKVRLVLLLSPT
jgi:hypothetical protein